MLTTFIQGCHYVGFSPIQNKIPFKTLGIHGDCIGILVRFSFNPAVMMCRELDSDQQLAVFRKGVVSNTIGAPGDFKIGFHTPWHSI